MFLRWKFQRGLRRFLKAQRQLCFSGCKQYANSGGKSIIFQREPERFATPIEGKCFPPGFLQNLICQWHETGACAPTSRLPCGQPLSFPYLVKSQCRCSSRNLCGQGPLPSGRSSCFSTIGLKAKSAQGFSPAPTRTIRDKLFTSEKGLERVYVPFSLDLGYSWVALRRFLTLAASPARPVPSKTIVVGSGICPQLVLHWPP